LTGMATHLACHGFHFFAFSFSGFLGEFTGIYQLF